MESKQIKKQIIQKIFCTLLSDHKEQNIVEYDWIKSAVQTTPKTKANWVDVVLERNFTG